VSEQDRLRALTIRAGQRPPVRLGRRGPGPVSPRAESMGIVDDLESLARDIDTSCRLTGRFTLRSGQVATEYFDKYLFEAQPGLLLRVARAMVPLLPVGAELLGGLELGGVPIATMVSYLTGTPTLFVRKRAKTYGTCRLAEGADVEGRAVVLVEDVITTGGAVRDAARELRKRGARVDVVVSAIDRSPRDLDPLRHAGLEVRSVLTREDLDQARQVPGATGYGRAARRGCAALYDGPHPHLLLNPRENAVPQCEHPIARERRRSASG
jgi:orotate phosphoribosyltransferase